MILKDEILPHISVIIPISSNSQELSILKSVRTVDYPKDKIEVLTSIGAFPSIQRNQAAKKANGEILYFFNRDAQFEPDIFRKTVNIITAAEDIAGAGGPDLTPPDNTRLQHLFGYAMSSYFAHWKMRARYSQLGAERCSDEKELLLSNLAVKREVFFKLNGFNEKLYPNEENELMNRIVKMGYKFIYSPDIKIYRDRRETLSAFAKQFYRYGQGRMKQIFIEGIWQNALFVVPLFLLSYIFSLPYSIKFRFRLVPLFVYVFFAIVDALYFSLKNKKNLTYVLPFTYIIMHISYAVGMLGCLWQHITQRKTIMPPENWTKKEGYIRYNNPQQGGPGWV